MLGGVHVHPEEAAELRANDDDGAGAGEAVDDRVGEEIDHQPKPQNPQRQLHHADHQSQQDGVEDERLAADLGQGQKRYPGHQRNHGHRPGGQLPAGAEQRAQDGG